MKDWDHFNARWRSYAASTLSAAMLTSKTRATSRFARAKVADGGEFCAARPAKPSFRKGTALFGSTMEPSRITAVAACLKEGCGIRKTARLTGASKDGVTAMAIRLGLHAKAVHDKRVRGLNITEAQLDEKWAFVGCKQKNCDPSDPADDAPTADDWGDQWDHTAVDVDSRMVVSLVVGKRTQENLERVVADFAERCEGAPPPALITTDDCAAYANVLMQQFGETVVPPRTGKPGRPRKPYKRWPAGAAYATVNKTYRKGKVAATRRTLVHGSQADLTAALAHSSNSGQINTAFVERQNGTDRTYNSRKRRKTYEFSKDLLVHTAVTWWVMLCYNFHHTNRGLRLKLADGSFVHRSPAVAAGLADAPLSITDILTLQVPDFIPMSRPGLTNFDNDCRTELVL